MFLAGGPAFSGTTLLAHLLNQGNLLCLDEPDFEKRGQDHRGLYVLQQLYPAARFPPRPPGKLSYVGAFRWTRAIEKCIPPINLGTKTCDWDFLRYALIYRAHRLPVIAIIRDIRDALVRPLPPWMDEAGLNKRYRLIWHFRPLYNVCLRYEDLVQQPERELVKLARVLRQPLIALHAWDPMSVHAPMLKLDRHALLTTGALATNRVGIWKQSDYPFSAQTLETATLMKYSM